MADEAFVFHRHNKTNLLHISAFNAFLGHSFIVIHVIFVNLRNLLVLNPSLGHLYVLNCFVLCCY